MQREQTGLLVITFGGSHEYNDMIEDMAPKVSRGEVFWMTILGLS